MSIEVRTFFGKEAVQKERPLFLAYGRFPASLKKTVHL
ncbi:hypothetical protein ADIS_1869 [Lunatimonas lonarensis]|uniref:Uncharacterized protein n=1 Tax=Lunatimonas lonarensis TaxID=1232681 RepID=R7ZU46_9BACT|nr:hypothetical protein ADIS_1869 [Lunatimonas lonarensis]